MQDATWAQTCKGTNATVGRNVGLINNAIGEDLGASTNMSIFNMAVWANMNAIAKVYLTFDNNVDVDINVSAHFELTS